MKIFSKKSLLLLLIVFLATLTVANPVLAVDPDTNDQTKSVPGSTLLPSKGDLTVSDCESLMRYADSHLMQTSQPGVYIDDNGKQVETTITTPSIKKQVAEKSTEIEFQSFDPKTGNTTYYNVYYTHVLGCAISTGSIAMWMIPFYIRFVLEFIIGLAGLLAVGGIVYGGYLYLFAGLSDDKDKGKNAIKNGILGLVLVMTAWAIVNVVISLVTL